MCSIAKEATVALTNYLEGEEGAQFSLSVPSFSFPSKALVREHCRSSVAEYVFLHTEDTSAILSLSRKDWERGGNYCLKTWRADASQFTSGWETSGPPEFAGPQLPTIPDHWTYSWL